MLTPILLSNPSLAAYNVEKPKTINVAQRVKRAYYNSPIQLIHHQFSFDCIDIGIDKVRIEITDLSLCIMHTFPIPLRYCSLHAFIKYLFVSNAISVHIRNPSIDVYKRLIVFFFFLYISVGVHLHANITHFHSICKFFSLPDSCELLHIYTIGTSFIFGVSWPTQK